MEKLLSIIVPVYNKELFLNECIESIGALNIDEDKIEAIFIDDCSSDNSLKIIEGYKNKYSFLKLIKLEENTGSPAEPRNVGIKNANGKYITFLDADDWLDSIGLPMLLKQAEENNADVAFGHSIKHTDKAISKLGRFTSYKVANDLIPYEINKIFRAVGPPGKIIKRDIIVENKIEFKHMKFGEDKLFFINAISKCKTASMNSTPVYHVNRYSYNQSLVGETNIIEKTHFNLLVLQEVLKLDIPKSAEFQSLSRLVEVDFISRLFNNSRFLKSENKAVFYNLFQQMIDTLNEHDKNVEDYIIGDKYKNIYQMIINKEYEKLFDFIGMLLKGGKADRYVKDNQIHFLMPETIKDYLPMKEELFAVYEGTHLIGNELREVIRVYKALETTIDQVLLTEINYELNAIEVEFFEDEHRLYVKTEDLSKCDFDFNINLIHDKYKKYTINMNLPNATQTLKLNRQNFKSEFIVNEKKSRKTEAPNKYFTFNPITVGIAKKVNLYKDVEFEERADANVEIGEIIEIKDIGYTKKNTPRLITVDGLVLTANQKFIYRVATSNANRYIYEKPETVIITKECKEYPNRDFSGEALKELKVNQKVAIQKVVASSKGTPRLKTMHGTFITANRNFVKEV
ncbi:glycosyltransferase family 2 protein [Staphylococcus equorum]|uniref:glycosyltransferase family 2 protein n=1 Tax=Staphylococcus equorum TaxID=246432 RepID=UPI000D1CA7C5|nr:glycosyltransferase family 2 protein [Staphylococcus equorum]PTE40414.1 glycosyltransferase family 2 protein [Staphylococcus equorum]PTE83897.1 glycosyltransferase family 2 protein [Staphylococcus equorum]PTF11789.1 glycosyltransferase family 2 protein [Staphylococcus equorum]